jgi:hypothetical protein
MTTALQLLKLLDSRHAELEREAGRHKAHTRGYDRAMGELGWFLAELPDLARLVPFVGASLQKERSSFPRLPRLLLSRPWTRCRSTWFAESAGAVLWTTCSMPSVSFNATKNRPDELTQI